MINPLEIAGALRRHPCVEGVELTGSRGRGDPCEHSDWDFVIETSDFARTRKELPLVLSPFHPLAIQWDRLSQVACCMLLLEGPQKVDLIFPTVSHRREAPWRASGSTLAAMDAHFWDWILWLVSKQEQWRPALVQCELHKMWRHLLEPLAVSVAPASLNQAVEVYRKARGRAEARFNVRITRVLEDEVRPLVRGQRAIVRAVTTTARGLN